MDKKTRERVVKSVAKRFADKLQSSLGPEGWEEMRRRNASPEYDGSCASHDFCDANVVMEGVFIDLRLSTEDLGDDNDQTKIWNNAWEAARRDHLTAAR